MIAAVYARKSNDQTGLADEAKSVVRQVEHARQWAARRGWRVDENHIYADDGISGAEFATRPGYTRLLNALKPRPPFDVLIVSELSRLGREQFETGYAMKQLAQAGVKVFSFLENREVLLENATDKFLLSAVNFAAEIEREKARQRTYDAMQRKARAGQVTGGRVFGYDNVEVQVSGRRSHVERHVNEAEAVVVRRIFELAAAGTGVRSIAKRLNDEGALSPRSQQGRPRAWAPSSVRAVLYRETYHGVSVWNASKKRDAWGQKHQQQRPEAERLRVPVPGLRIVPEELWTAAHARLLKGREAYLRGTDGRLWGRPATGVESKYLLPGIGRCAICGGGLIVTSRSHGRRRASFYSCGSYHLRGRSVCPNNLDDAREKVEQAVLTAFADQLLGPGMVDEIVAAACEKAKPVTAGLMKDRSALQEGLERVDAEIRNLTAAIAAGGQLASLVAALKERETDRDRMRRQLAGSENAERKTVASPAKLREQLEERMADWRGVLRRQGPTARQILKKLVTGPLRFTPKQDEDGTRYYEFEGDGTLAKMLVSITHPILVASPTECAKRVTVGGLFQRAA